MTIDSFLKHKKILIFGLGRQGGGVGDANYLAQHHYTVRATDLLTKEQLGLTPKTLDQRVSLNLGGHSRTDIDWADLIIINPGVALDNPFVVYAQSQGKPVFTSISLFVKYSPIPTIGVTGTRGKTTTTMLIYQILNTYYSNQILLGGNVPGTSGLSLFKQTANKKYAVLELSSFQLSSFHSLNTSPNYAVVTNLYPDHLNRYATMASYQFDKEAIVAYQKSTDLTLYNSENPGSVAIGEKSAAKIVIPYDSNLARSYPTRLPGVHNQSNLSAAIALCTKLNVPNNIIKKAVADFDGVPYRQQLIATQGGVDYINDTTATTPTAALIALQAQTRPTILICGGESKNLPFDDFVNEIIVNPHVKHIIILGSANLKEFTDNLSTRAQNKILGQVNSMPEAIDLARAHVLPGDTVLLSPGFASFDLFKNEFDRGDQFNACVLGNKQ